MEKCVYEELLQAAYRALNYHAWQMLFWSGRTPRQETIKDIMKHSLNDPIKTKRPGGVSDEG